MKKAISIALGILVPMALFPADNGYKVMYDGGSLPDIKAGANFKLYIGPDQIWLTNGKEAVIRIPASSITEISYGQDVHRRVGAAIGLATSLLG